MRNGLLTLPTTLITLGLLAATLGAQQNPRSLGAGSGPTISIDFGAVDSKGNPIADLTAADVAVRIDGKVREVRGLQVVRHEAPSLAAAPTGDPLPQPFAANVSTGGGGRAVYVIFDNETVPTGREQRVKDALLKLINSLGPRDQASIVTVPRGGASVGLTSDRAKLTETAGRLLGAAPASETGDEAACRSRLTVQAITALLGERAGAETPTEVVLVSSSLTGPRSNVTSGNTRLGTGNVGGCDLPADEFNKLGLAAAAARARFFIVRPEQPASQASTALDSALAGLENIASVTGGYIWHMAGSDEPSFQRVALETSSYYSATIELDPADRTAPTRQLSIKTTRPDVTIRARPTIAFGRDTSTKVTAAPSPKDLMKTATVFRDVPMRVAAFASRNPGDGKLRVVAIAESINGSKMAAASIGLYDTGGKLVAQWSATATELTAPSLVAAFVQNPGTYRVRVAVNDAAGRAGTADYELNATLTPAAGSLTVSHMMLGTGGTSFTPKLQFTSEPTVVAYFELYGGKAGMPVTVAMELASSLNGPAIAQLQPQIAPSSEPDMFRVVAPVNIGALPAGDYIVRAIVGLDGQPAGRIVRTLRKSQ